METAASVIAVAQLCEKVIKYVNSATGAKEDRGRLRDQIRACSVILLQLKDEAEDLEEGKAWSDTIAALATPLSRLHKALEMAAINLHKEYNTKEKLKWPFKDREVQKLIEAIESEKSLLILALENNSARLLQEINMRSKENKTHLMELTSLLKTTSKENEDSHNNIKSAISAIQDSHATLHHSVYVVREQQDKQDSSAERQKILDWLSPVDHSTQQHDMISRRQVGTGNWVLQSVHYQNWLNAGGQTLYCPGIPGAGKTIVTSIVVADLWEIYYDDPDIAIAFFYCDYRRQDEQTLETVFSSILKQLVEGRAVLSKSIQDFYNRFEQRRRRPVFEDVLEALRTELSSFSKAFVLIDALDECHVSARLLSELFALQKECNINLFATSRFIPDIIMRFEGAGLMEIRASAEDVQKYLEAHIHRLPRFVSLSSTLQEEIQTSVTKSVDGMFLLAKLHLDSLIGKRSIKAVRNALKSLATGSGAYDSAYSAAMERIECQVADQADLAKQVLAWIIHAKRQLTALELQEALGVEAGECKLDRDNCPDVDDMISACAGLVTLDEGSGTIRLVHYTTQEYFERTQLDWFPDAEAMITTTCTSYLSFSAFEGLFDRLRWRFRELCDYAAANNLCDYAVANNLYEYVAANNLYEYVAANNLYEYAAPNGLYDYAVHNWGHHARSTPSAFTQIMDFLTRPINVAVSGTQLYIDAFRDLVRDKYLNDALVRGVSALHLAAYFGLEAATATLLKFSAPDPRDSFGTTPLMVAALFGHISVVKLLLERYAAAGAVDRHEVAPMALEAGERPNLRDIGPLHCAAYSGHTAIAQLLLEFYNCDSSSGAQRVTPLHLAARSGHYDVAKLFLTEQGDVNAKDDQDQTPLHAAVKAGSVAIVQLLLENHAMVDSRGSTLGQTPLQLATEFNREDIASMLISAGANSKIRDKFGQTLIRYAARHGYEGIVQLLIDDGVDTELCNVWGEQALICAVQVFESYMSVVSSLLDAGAEENCQTESGESPLHVACIFGNGVIVGLPLDAGAVVNCQLEGGESPLHVACIFRREVIVKLLLDAGADINCVKRNRWTPLHSACAIGYEAVVKALLDAGAVIVCWKEGKTPLQIARKKRHNTVVELLLAHGE